ncbi:hypothetical protein DPMN_098281 [Dreissena polymorpha]|uniref:Uncharacterized protein n=1 Tax=Dreissena polymorpha TaxID=45954 RepID=A0A9D4LCQ7_DREPO|nr:hypothetical protein DPMN_098281 [Dreissena polymorpha]
MLADLLVKQTLTKLPSLPAQRCMRRADHETLWLPVSVPDLTNGLGTSLLPDGQHGNTSAKWRVAPWRHFQPAIFAYYSNLPLNTNQFLLPSYSSLFGSLVRTSRSRWVGGLLGTGGLLRTGRLLGTGWRCVTSMGVSLDIACTS